MHKAGDIQYKDEVLRKLIHLCSLSIPIVYIYLTQVEMAMVVVPMFLIALFVDVGSHYFTPINRLLNTFFGNMLREHEKDSDKFLLNGATYVLMSAVACVLLLPKIIAITAFSILIISDICSALIGRRFGKTRFLDKSLVGFTAFCISAAATVAVIGLCGNGPAEFYLLGIVGGVFAGIVESASVTLRMDDNASIPLAVSIIMWGGMHLFFDISVIDAITNMLQVV